MFPDIDVVNVALQVGVPFSLEKVTLGFELAFEKLFSTQNSLRASSLEAGAVVRKVVVTLSSDSMAISMLALSSLESSVGVAAFVGAATTARGSEAARQSMPTRLVAGVCLGAG